MLTQHGQFLVVVGANHRHVGTIVGVVFPSHFLILITNVRVKLLLRLVSPIGIFSQVEIFAFQHFVGLKQIRLVGLYLISFRKCQRILCVSSIRCEGSVFQHPDGRRHTICGVAPLIRQIVNIIREDKRNPMVGDKGLAILVGFLDIDNGITSNRNHVVISILLRKLCILVIAVIIAISSLRVFILACWHANQCLSSSFLNYNVWIPCSIGLEDSPHC